MSPLHPRLVDGAQQSATDQSKDGRGQSQPLLRAGVWRRTTGAPTVFGGEETFLFILGHTPLPEVLATHTLEHGETQGVEQKVPSLVLLLHEAAGRQAQSVSNCAGQEQNVQLRQRPFAAVGLQWRLDGTNKQERLQTEEENVHFMMIFQLSKHRSMKLGR